MPPPQKDRPPHHPRLLGAVLPLLRHPLQRRPGANHEHRARPQPRTGAAPILEGSLHRPRALLRRLCRLRLPVQSHHDSSEPPHLDEQDRLRCRSHRGLFRCCQGRVEFVSLEVSARRCHCGNVAGDGLLPYSVLSAVEDGKRIGMYFTAAQVSAAVVGLVSAGFQLMDGDGGLVGFQWMFLIYGLCAIILGVALLWWLPDRPLAPGEEMPRTGIMKWLPAPKPALTGEDAQVHYEDLRRVYHPRPWNIRDLMMVLIDWRLWPLLLMYFGVVGVGIGTQLYGTVIISGINPKFTGVQLSLLFAPIWIVSGLLQLRVGKLLKQS